MAERFIQIGQPSQEMLKKLTQPPEDITRRNADIYTTAGTDVLGGIDYVYDITAQMEDQAFDPPKR